MHAFEQGKLILWPNTLLFFGGGCLAGILFIFLLSFYNKKFDLNRSAPKKEKDLLFKSQLRSIFSGRWPQLILILFGFVMIYVVIITATIGTKVSGRNFGVLLMWAIWLFILVAVLTPLAGRAWCTICPLPFIGDWMQRRSFFVPEKGTTNGYKNQFYGLFLKWPEKLKNSWFKLFVFLLLSTFSTTLVAVPQMSGLVVLGLLIIPVIMSGIFELRAFCRYVCPVTVFVSPFSGMSLVTLKNKDQSVCDSCKGQYCLNGSATGWACPYGINVAEMKVNTDCGLCLECLRSCPYKNVSLFSRSFGSKSTVRDWSEAWLSISIFTMAIVYSIVYLGPWPIVRDYVNIIDKGNWDLFGIYTLLIWTTVLLILPGILYLLAFTGKKSSKIKLETKEIFLSYVSSLLPLGLMIWISFVIPMLFINITFIIQAASDPFGWGWDLFGKAGTPWHQFIPQYIPWIQVSLVLYGCYLSLKNIKKTFIDSQHNNKLLRLTLPIALFIIAIAALMINFYSN
jgi:polyferredoxin